MGKQKLPPLTRQEANAIRLHCQALCDSAERSIERIRLVPIQSGDRWKTPQLKYWQHYIGAMKHAIETAEQRCKEASNEQADTV